MIDNGIELSAEVDKASNLSQITSKNIQISKKIIGLEVQSIQPALLFDYSMSDSCRRRTLI